VLDVLSPCGRHSDPSQPPLQQGDVRAAFMGAFYVQASSLVEAARCACEDRKTFARGAKRVWSIALPSRGVIRPSWNSSPLNRGSRETGCALHPRSRVQGAQKKCAHEHTGSAGAFRPSLRKEVNRPEKPR